MIQKQWDKAPQKAQKQWGKVYAVQRKNKENEGRKQDMVQDMVQDMAQDVVQQLDRVLDHGTVVKFQLDREGYLTAQLSGLTVVVVVVWVDWA